MSIILNSLQEAATVLNAFIANEKNLANIEAAAQLLAKQFKNGNKVLSFGNGGSMADAIHFAEELSGKFREERKALPALSLSDPGHITCVSNDYGFDFIFSRQVEALGKEGDILLAISTSGNSKNVLEACKIAKQKGIHIIALTGKKGGALANECDIEIRVDHQGYADRIQEIHIKVIHCLIERVESLL